MTSTIGAIKEYETVKVCHLDLMKTTYDEWKIDFYNLIGASTPSLYYLLSSPALDFYGTGRLLSWIQKIPRTLSKKP